MNVHFILIRRRERYIVSSQEEIMQCIGDVVPKIAELQLIQRTTFWPFLMNVFFLPSKEEVERVRLHTVFTDFETLLKLIYISKKEQPIRKR